MKRKNAIICGASSGIGFATMKQLCEQGYDVVNVDCKDPTEVLPNTRFVRCDLSQSNAVLETMNDLTDSLDTLDAFFYSAGIHHNDYLEDMPLEAYQRLVDTNVTGMFMALKPVLKFMKAQGFGAIALMGSEQTVMACERNSIYAMTKAAIAQLTRSLALDNAPFGIRVNCVSPGTTDTPMFRTAVENASKRTGTSVENIVDCSKEGIPLQRLAAPDEIANAVIFLLSDQSSYVTGTNLFVDGGSTIH